MKLRLIVVALITGCGARQAQESTVRGASADVGIAYGDGRGAHLFAQSDWYTPKTVAHVRGWYERADEPDTDGLVPVERPALWSFSALAGVHGLTVKHGYSRGTEIVNCRTDHRATGTYEVCTERDIAHDRGRVRGAAALAGLQLEGRGAEPTRTSVQLLLRGPFGRAYGTATVPRAYVDLGLTGVVAGRGSRESYWKHAAFMPGGMLRVHFVYYIAGVGIEAGTTGLQHRTSDGSLTVDTYVRLLLTLGADLTL